VAFPDPARMYLSKSRMTLSTISHTILTELRTVFETVENDQAELLVKSILEANRVFVCGQGRSGFVMRSFAMRLMHLGLHAFVVGETITPNIERGDLLIVGSCSGETPGSVLAAKTARGMGVRVASITCRCESSLAQLSDVVVIMPVKSGKIWSNSGIASSIQPQGSFAEQSLFIYLDCIVVRLMEEMGQDSEEILRRHANLE
jgi:6-phospho-3-hexuloisomerase